MEGYRQIWKPPLNVFQESASVDIKRGPGLGCRRYGYRNSSLS